MGFQNQLTCLACVRTPPIRSNVAVQNMGTASDGNITLQITVYSGDPNHWRVRGVDIITLAPGGWQQLNEILSSNGLSLKSGYVYIMRISGTAPYYAYGTINDNANSDGSFIPPIPQSSFVGKTRMTLPVIVENSFTSELSVANWSAYDKSLQFRYVASAISTDDHIASFDLTLKYGEQKIISDLVQYLRTNAVLGVGPPQTSFAGALFVKNVNSMDLSGISISARTSTSGGGGEYGLFYTAMPTKPNPASMHGCIVCSRTGGTERSRALVNTGEIDGGDDIFQIDLYDGTTGAQVGSVPSQTLSAFEWRQLNSILSTYARGTTAGYAHITRIAGQDPFLTFDAVINDGGTPGARSGDGAFIASAP